MSKATIKDIARAANVSVATVSRVVNNGPKVGAKTRERIQHLISTMGYQPNINARSLVMKKAATIGVVIPDVADPFLQHSPMESTKLREKIKCSYLSVQAK